MSTLAAAEEQAILAFGEQFVKSPLPQAIIYVPRGCLLLAVNPAHPSILRDGSIAPVFAGTPKEFLQIVEGSSRLDELDVEESRFKCYCEGIGAVDILELAHCALNQIFEAATNPFVVNTNPDFFLRRPRREETNQTSRTYDIRRVDGRRLSMDRNLLAVALRELPGLSCRVDSDVQQSFIDVSLRADLINGEKTIPGMSFPLNGTSERYRAFARELDKVAFGDRSDGNVSSLHDRLLHLERSYMKRGLYLERGVLREVLTVVQGGNRVSEEDLRVAVRNRQNSIFDYFALSRLVDAGDNGQGEIIRNAVDKLPAIPEFGAGTPPPIQPAFSPILEEAAASRLVSVFLALDRLFSEDVRELIPEELRVLRVFVSLGWVAGGGLDGYCLTEEGITALRSHKAYKRRKAS